MSDFLIRKNQQLTRKNQQQTPPCCYSKREANEFRRPQYRRRRLLRTFSPSCVFGGNPLLKVLETVTKAALKSGREPSELRDAMIAAWRDYDASR